MAWALDYVTTLMHPLMARVWAAQLIMHKMQRKLAWLTHQGLHLLSFVERLRTWLIKRQSKWKYHHSNLETPVTSEGQLEDPKLLISPQRV